PALSLAFGEMAKDAIERNAEGSLAIGPIFRKRRRFTAVHDPEVDDVSKVIPKPEEVRVNGQVSVLGPALEVDRQNLCLDWKAVERRVVVETVEQHCRSGAVHTDDKHRLAFHAHTRFSPGANPGRPRLR